VHAASYKTPNGFEIDVHWNVLMENYSENASSDYWKNGIDCNIDNISIKVLNPTNQFFHTCVHGAKYNMFPPFYWIADAIFMLRSSEFSIDWQELLKIGRDRGNIYSLKMVLNYLKKEFNAPIPDEALSQFNAEKLTFNDKLKYFVFSGQRSSLSSLTKTFYLFSSYRRTRKDKQNISLITFYLEFYKAYWKLDKVWKVPFYGLKKLFV
jgi:hypothetical protein